jgi:hypothetical protein
MKKSNIHSYDWFNLCFLFVCAVVDFIRDERGVKSGTERSKFLGKSFPEIYTMKGHDFILKVMKGLKEAQLRDVILHNLEMSFCFTVVLYKTLTFSPDDELNRIDFKATGSNSFMMETLP